MLIGDVRYEYSITLNQDRIEYEGLFHYPKKKRSRVFEREGRELTLQRGLGDLSGVRQLLTDRTLALSAAHRYGNPSISEFVVQLRRISTRGMARSGDIRYPWTRFRGGGGLPTDSWFDIERREPPSDIVTTDARREAIALLRLADLGIDDVVFIEQPAHSPDRPPFRQPRLVHRTSSEQLEMDFESESAGTQSWYRLIGPLLTALRTGSLLLFDEIDASLHPTLSAQLISLFHDPSTNPGGAQLIFTTHDTSLLNHLNRDEVWLTEKRPDGSTRLGALAEFAGERVRKSQNLENAYLHGRFGALPDVDRADLLRSLGLIG
jgi:hypothetical protein